MEYKELIEKDYLDLLAYVDNIGKNISSYYRKYYNTYADSRMTSMLKKYTEHYYRVINSFLLGNTLPNENMTKKAMKDARNLDIFISRCKAPTNLTLYRGTVYREFYKSAEVTESTIKNLTFYSTSLSPMIARRFARNGNDCLYDKEYIILEFELPQFYPTIYLEPVTSIVEEHELLIKPKSKFEIVNEKRINDDEKDMVARVIKLRPI